MKKNNKKGFTLIELLAVLVILAILALIAIPIVIKVINNAREDSYKRSIESYARAVEMGLARYAMLYPGEAFPTKIDDIKNKETNESFVDTKGDQVVCLDFEVDTNGQIKLGRCLIYKSGEEISEKTLKTKDHYFKYENNVVDEDVKYESEQAPIQPAYEAYNIGDTFTFGGAGYHVIAQSSASEDKVTAFKDEPLTVDEVTELGYTPSYTYTETTKAWAGMHYDNTEPKSSVYETSDVKQVVDAWAAKLPDGVSEARLIKFRELTTDLGYDETTWNGTDIKLNSSTTPSWVYNSEYSYWTMSPQNDSASGVWVISRNGGVYSSAVSNYKYGVIRPVINVLKSAITKN